MAIANFGIFGAVLLGLGVKKVFFGRLRGVEYEVSRYPRLSEAKLRTSVRAWRGAVFPPSLSFSISRPGRALLHGLVHHTPSMASTQLCRLPDRELVGTNS